MGFTFLMAVNQFDQRKQLIIKRVNAIGTTWLRSASLPEPLRSEEQQLLREYVSTRVRFLSSSHNEEQMRKSLTQTLVLQAQLWASVNSYATEHRDPVTALQERKA
jgi:hypothetical protein